MNQRESVDFTRKWRVFAAVGSGVFLATVDGSIINVSLPTLVRALDTHFAAVQWVVLAYLLTVTTTMLGFGRMGDIHGKKKIYLLGFIIFTLGSAACGLASSVHGLIAFRVVQAVGSAMIMALGPAIVTEAFPPGERGKAMGLIGVIVSGGIVIGPAAGGLILGALTWRWIFYVNLPVGIVGTLLVWRNIPDFKPSARQPFDFKGAAALFASLLSLLLALTFGQRQGFGAPLVLFLFGLWVALLVVFLRIEHRSAHPMIDLAIFGNPLFSVSLATGFITFVALAGVLLLMPFYLENMLGFAPLKVGLLLGIVPLMLGVAAPVSGILSDRLGARPLTLAGLAILFAGYLAAATLGLDTTIEGYLLRMFAVGLGMGVFISPNNSAIMGAAARHRLGIASGFMALTRTLGQTVGVAVMGAIWAGRTAVHAAGGHRPLAPGLDRTAQIAGLRETLYIAAVLIGVAVLIGAVTLIRSTRGSNNPAGGGS